MLKYGLGQMAITEQPNILPTHYSPPGLSNCSQVRFSRVHDTVNHFNSLCGENVPPQKYDAFPNQSRVLSSNGRRSATPSPLRHSANVNAPNHLVDPGMPTVYGPHVPSGYAQPRHISHPSTCSRDATATIKTVQISL